MSELRSHVDNWESNTPAWQKGWIAFEEDQIPSANPYNKGSDAYNDFQVGWQEADFAAKVEGGYYDE